MEDATKALEMPTVVADAPAKKPRRKPQVPCPQCGGTGKIDKPKKGKPQSRADRWRELAGDAAAALNELADLQGEYQGWLDNLPDNLQNSPTGEKLQEVCNIDLSSAADAAGEAEGVDLPLGWGQD